MLYTDGSERILAGGNNQEQWTEANLGGRSGRRMNMIQLPPNRHGNTMLHFAASGPNFPLLRAVLTDGYDVNAKNNNGETALDIAVKHHRQDNAVELLRYGANPDQLDDETGL
jgi:ankyrin repeat protein